MPSFITTAFAVAGVVAALGPVVLHLLHRRRFRVVRWGAMELLREAALQRRRMTRLRDLLLLALRVACLILLGLGLARPYFSRSGEPIDPHQSVHAILVIDNSLSMAYGGVGGTLLDQAKARGKELIDRLPEGSRFSIVPLCTPEGGWDRQAYRVAADARETLDQIQTLDRTATALEAIELAREAAAEVPELPSKRILFLGDQQQIVWPQTGLEEALRGVPEFQVVAIQSSLVENAWIEEFRVEDDLADAATPAQLLAVIRYQGDGPRRDVIVTLAVDGATVASQIVDLQPGQARQVQFSHQFAPAAEPGETAFVPAVVSLAPDRLPIDDARFLVVPVVASLPVVFVDQHGAAGEKPGLNRYGETFPLRRLMEPATGPASAGEAGESKGGAHLTIDQLDRRALQDARLVVIAGVASPQAAVPLLREYVEQGGQLVIAAGGEFNPIAWTSEAWRDGAGLLPAPLSGDLIGKLPDQSQATLDPFLLSPASMSDEFFDMAGASREELEDLYRTPLFFQAVRVQLPENGSGPPVTPATPDSQPDNRERGDSEPWLRWNADRLGRGLGESPAVTPGAPRVLASFSNGLPFLVEQQIGEGSILFVSSGIGSHWNNLARTNAVLLFDRWLRRMLSRTLPRRMYETFEQATLSIPAADRRAEISLEWIGQSPTRTGLGEVGRPREGGGAGAAVPPSGAAGLDQSAAAATTESISVEALGPERFGVVLRRLVQRGLCLLVADRPVPSGSSAAATSQRAWELTLAVNGPAAESDLRTLDEAELQQRLGDAQAHWIARQEPVPLQGTDLYGHGLWKWLLGAVIVTLAVEMACLGWSRPAA